MSDQETVKPAGVPGTGGSGGTTAPAPHKAAPRKSRQKWLLLILLIAIGGLGYAGWRLLRPKGLPPGFTSANGRIEATEIDVSTKLAGRLKDELVHEGDFVTAGEVVAHMDIDTLTAQLREAQAKRGQAQAGVQTALKTEQQRKEEKDAAEAVVRQREAELGLAKKKFARVEVPAETGAVSKEELDVRRADQASAEANLAQANANVAASEAAIATAQALVIGANESVQAAEATIERIQADINDSTLKAPRAGRVQYRIAQPGEVLPAGGKVLNMVDLADVYMTFFLPTAWAGRVRLGSDVRLILDAAPELVIPAKVTFVSDVAQFTPKTVETAEERQKLTFRIKAHIPPELLKEHIRDVKTGLPGLAYVQLDPQAQWPANLQVRLPEE